SNPISFIVKSGYAGVGASDDVSSDHVTREYQICFKCHSNYAYGNNPPTSGPTIPTNTNMTQYTNQAMEFQAPDVDKEERASGETGSAANHRSWHPVMKETGRTRAIRKADSAIFNSPWLNDGVERMGVQTMYCSDCHGSSSLYIEADVTTHNVDPAPDGAWGPHGSDNSFILKGNWDSDEINMPPASELCFRCHNVSSYSAVNFGDVKTSGFSGPNWNNLHAIHEILISKPRLRCTWCHVAIPHGWRNKALLVDIASDPEAASCGGVAPCGTVDDPLPYYKNAYLGGAGPVNWRVSGEWEAQDCNNISGSGCTNSGWMIATCQTPS
ncbi:Cytochrome c family protein, partial [hydrothermal vent metagenome]